LRVIGHTRDGVLLEATNEELGRIIGYDSVGDLPAGDERVKNSNDFRWERTLKLGTVIQVSPMWDWMTVVRAQFKKVLATAKLLAGIAEILENAPPVALVEPEE